MLHIDIETYSDVDIQSSGAYRYIENDSFEIMLIGYAFGDKAVKIVDIANGDSLPYELFSALKDPAVIKVAHNAQFERLALRKAFGATNENWFCNEVYSGYCGYPMSLEDSGKALKLGSDKAKMKEGKELIKLFCCPQKPTKKNSFKTRITSEEEPEKWETFKDYCVRDVEAEREIFKRLSQFPFPDQERINYYIDQTINDNGVLVDLEFVRKAAEIGATYVEEVKQELIELTGIDNPKSVQQFKAFLEDELDEIVESVNKEFIPQITELAATQGNEKVLKALELRAKISKSSTTKYVTMLESVCKDGRIRGLLQFYGASRTGRFAGRLVQIHNLPQNHLIDLDAQREAVKAGGVEFISTMYENVQDVLSQLIRTAFIAKEGHTFAVADYSAIEARVIAWLAGEKWRLDVFATHGKIYEASASMMFKVPIESITKGSPLRQKGKIAELALGYQGGVGALKTMGGERMGLSEPEMKGIVDAWREANPAIKQLWYDVDNAAKKAIKTGAPQRLNQGVLIYMTGGNLAIQLPSKRCLYYVQARIGQNRFDGESITYMGMDQTTKQWVAQETYGGKLVENIVQAISRDLLTHALYNLITNHIPVAIHVHDEAVPEIPTLGSSEMLKEVERLMCDAPDWAKTIPLRADGFLTSYYKKD